MMEQRLFLLLFFTGVVPLVLSVPRRYYLIQPGKTWSDAQVYCRATYTDMALIQSNDDMIRFQNEVQKQHFSSSAWIGIYGDVNSWRWSLGNEPLGSLRSWYPGMPNNQKGDYFCAVISRWFWNDRSCTELNPFLCFDDTITGLGRFIYFSNTVTWYEAQTYCRTHYTDLASCRDATEDSDIKTIVTGYTWFGLFRDSWKWTDQTNFSTISWMPGKPDNALGNEDCGYINNNQAADAQCSDIMPFFCYRNYTGKQQIIRAKVRSNQDVNDPAVKAAILDQINQKLKDHGMAENITVTWREQPDGNVFHKEKGINTTEISSSECLQSQGGGM